MFNRLTDMLFAAIEPRFNSSGRAVTSSVDTSSRNTMKTFESVDRWIRMRGNNTKCNLNCQLSTDLRCGGGLGLAIAISVRWCGLARVIDRCVSRWSDRLLGPACLPRGLNCEAAYAEERHMASGRGQALWYALLLSADGLWSSCIGCRVPHLLILQGHRARQTCMWQAEHPCDNPAGRRPPLSNSWRENLGRIVSTSFEFPGQTQNA